MPNMPFSTEDNYYNPMDGILQGVGMLGAVGAGGYGMYSSMKSNGSIAGQGSAKGSNLFQTATPVGQMGKDIGNSLRASSAVSKARKQKAAREFADKMMDTKEIHKLLSTIQDQHAVLQSMLSTLDNPEAGFGQAATMGFRAQLENAAQGLSQSQDVRDVLSGLFQEMYSNNTEAGGVFRTRLREYKGVKHQLETPNFKTKAHTPYIRVGQLDMSEHAARRFGRVKDIASRYSSFDPATDLVAVRGSDGGLYGQVWSGNANSANRRLMMTVPLDVKDTKASKRLGSRVMQIGASGTQYVAAQDIFDVQQAMQMIQSGTPLTRQNLKAQGALMDAEDYIIGVMDKLYQGGRRLPKAEQLNQHASQILTHLPRLTRDQGRSLGHHVDTMIKNKANRALVVGFESMSKKEQEVFMRAVAVADSGYDFGAGPEALALSNFQGMSNMTLNITQGNPISMMRSGFGKSMQLNRVNTPVVARIEQIRNRDSEMSMYLSKGGRIGLGGVFASGATTGQGDDILWDAGYTGGTNRAMVIDVGSGRKGQESGRLWRGLEDKGFGYHTKAHAAVKGGAVVLSDPTAHGGMSSELLNQIMAADGEWVEFTPEEMLKARGYLGVGTDSEGRYEYLDPQARKYSYRLDRVEKSAGHQKIALMREVERVHEREKLFSVPFKGSLDLTSMEKAEEIISGYGLSSEQLQTRWGVDSADMMLISGDMYKKSMSSWGQQLSTSYAMASGDKAFEATLAAEVEVLRKNPSLAHGLIAANKPHNDLALQTAATMRALKARNVDAETAGRVMALVFNRGLDDVDKRWTSGRFEDYTMSRKAFDALAQSLYGDQVGSFLQGAGSGLLVTAATGQQGQGVGDWSKATASSEPRLFEMFQFKMRGLGMKEEHITKVMVDLMQRKSGSVPHLELTGVLADMAESAQGFKAPQVDGAMRVTMSELTEKMVDSGSKSLREFLATQEKGIILDFAGDQSERGKQFAKMAKETMRADSIYIGGSEAIGYSKGTFIKSDTGFSTAIASDYDRMLEKFGENMQRLWGMDKTSDGSIGAAMRSYQNELSEVFTRTFQSLSSGRIKGSSFMDAYAYDLDANTNLTNAQRMIVDQAMSRSGNNAIFMNAAGFVSQITDMSKGDRKFALEKFFTGLHKSEVEGVTMLSARNPILSVGLTNITEVFRHVGEIDNDAAFEHLKSTKWGKKALARFRGEEIKGFADIASSKNSQAQRGFWSEFAANTQGFMGSTGGGVAYIAQSMKGEAYTIGGTERNLQKAEKKLDIDLGIAKQAGADMDGDKIAFYSLQKGSSGALHRLMQDPEAIKRVASYDRDFKFRKQLYLENTKQALNNLSEKLFSTSSVAYEDAMKEKSVKEMTGIIDSSLNDMRRGVLNYADPTTTGGITALFDVLEEHTTIKGKKLPVYFPFAEQMSAAVREATQTGDFSSFRSVMHQIFEGSDYRSHEVTADAIIGGKMSLENDLNIIEAAMRQARANYAPGALGSTANRLKNATSAGNPAEAARIWEDSVRRAGSLQSGMLNATMSPDAVGEADANAAVRAASGVLKGLDRNMLGLTAAGIGAAFVGAQVMTPIRDKQPLDGSWEQSDPIIAAEGLSGGTTPYDMVQRPLQPATHYERSSNAYNMTGQVSSSRVGLGSVIDYMGSVHHGSSPHVSVNDMRRPITRSYMDRLAGEY